MYGGGCRLTRSALGVAGMMAQWNRCWLPKHAIPVTHRCTLLVLEVWCVVPSISQYVLVFIHVCTAALAGAEKMVKLLLDQGADPRTENHEGLVPFDVAFKNHNWKAAEEVLSQFPTPQLLLCCCCASGDAEC